MYQRNPALVDVDFQQCRAEHETVGTSLVFSRERGEKLVAQVVGPAVGRSAGERIYCWAVIGAVAKRPRSPTFPPFNFRIVIFDSGRSLNFYMIGRASLRAGLLR